MDFSNMHQGIYGVLKTFKLTKKDLKKFSLDIIISMYFIKYILDSISIIKSIQITRSKKTFNIKNFFLPCIIYSVNRLEELQSNLQIKFYKLNYKKTNFSSKIIFILTLLIFIVSIFKEVM